MLYRLRKWMYYRRWKVKIQHTIEVLRDFDQLMQHRGDRRSTRRRFFNSIRSDRREAVSILKDVLQEISGPSDGGGDSGSAEARAVSD